MGVGRRGDGAVMGQAVWEQTVGSTGAHCTAGGGAWGRAGSGGNGGEEAVAGQVVGGRQGGGIGAGSESQAACPILPPPLPIYLPEVSSSPKSPRTRP